ncbi:hypothetical protein [Oceanihabitans sediminis]|uniref:Uncharacterized protein n=1 Tax=Oceanihabitans sediminis TaxID=1812012 RepID=A0A368P7C0_9FLAO|nr:hypothetical protein [Oceanihabitans sediminis]MDX1278380.1 hypothetical protein [Oceanihabitans sediminis]RBP34322.1 hypothetical protein DFR65_101210 [Oceanihabitans sediminis]RCU58004.1 hypothetical protein DU428_01040 [Oceanihabitans sediminis]
MTLYEFNKLDMNARMEVTNQKGVFLDNYITDKERINLYAIDMFFVEVVYTPKKNFILEVRSFKTGQSLDKYSKDFSDGF